MKKKEAPKFKTFPGWNCNTDYRGFCGACGHVISLGEPTYWKHSGKGLDLRTIVRCKVCVEDK